MKKVSSRQEESELALALLEQALDGEDTRTALSELCTLCRKKTASVAVNLHSKRFRLPLLLKHEDPKVRKNTARLLGELRLQVDKPALQEALFEERTQYVIPTMILALGALGDEDTVLKYKQILGDLQDLDPKHAEDIRYAIDKVLTSQGEASFSGLKSPMTIELAAPLTADILAAEAAAQGLQVDVHNNTVSIVTADYPSLFRLRCFEEALFPLGSALALPETTNKQALHTWSENTAHVAARFASFVEETLGKGVGFRIELRGAPYSIRAFICRAIANRLSSSSTLINAVSDYSAELRITCQQAVTLLHAKLYDPPDPRFAYRKDTVPASMAPHTAAALLRFALPYLKPGARVYDPCCGSGTLLIERALLLRYSSLIGTDVSAKAVAIALQNAQAADVPAQYHNADALDFEPGACDEIISNLPFGSRVGSGSASQRLYGELFARLDRWLAPDGVAIFYTTQLAPVLRLAAANGFEAVAQHRFEAGGLNPSGIILKRS